MSAESVCHNLADVLKRCKGTTFFRHMQTFEQQNANKMHFSIIPYGITMSKVVSAIIYSTRSCTFVTKG